MKVQRYSNRKGFTLVEILIVVIILGILAAIVIPQFTNASEDARKSSLSSQVQTLRSQISLYKLQHRDTPPDLANFWTKLTTKTDDSGAAYTGAAGQTGPFGPYFQAPVINPLNSQTDPAAAVGSGVGWCYNEANGELHGVNKDSNAMTDNGTDTATWNTAPAASGG